MTTQRVKTGEYDTKGWGIPQIKFYILSVNIFLALCLVKPNLVMYVISQDRLGFLLIIVVHILNIFLT